MRKSVAALLLGAFAAIQSLPALGGPITVPAGLLPGEQYRLAFVTITTRDATSSNIADYNSFVTTAANSVPQLTALGTTWTAIASTASVNADDNTNTNPGVSAGVPIYNLGGALVAINNQALWGTVVPQEGAGPPLSAPIWIDERGDPPFQTGVWTGTSPYGTARSPLGSVGTPTFGLNTKKDSNWISFGEGGTPPPDQNLYAISGVLTVPTPEPSTMVLACLAAAGLTIVAIRKRRTR